MRGPGNTETENAGLEKKDQLTSLLENAKLELRIIHFKCHNCKLDDKSRILA